MLNVTHARSEASDEQMNMEHTKYLYNLHLTTSGNRDRVHRGRGQSMALGFGKADAEDLVSESLPWQSSELCQACSWWLAFTVAAGL